MALIIRLSRIGQKNQPKYRVVVTEHRNKTVGKHLEIVGFYDPIVNPPVVTLRRDRIAYWQKNGAQVSDTVRNLLK